MRAFIKNYKITLIDKLFKDMLWKKWNNIVKWVKDILDILTFKKIIL